MNKVTAILIAAVAVFVAAATVSISRSEAATSHTAGPNPFTKNVPELNGDRSTGVWVNGEGTISVSPDLAILTIGVEASAPTVSEANGEAANSMDAVVATLKKNQVKDTDIQTKYFSIYPQYDYIEVQMDGTTRNQEVLTGYRVNNSASVKLRDLDAIGKIIDEVVAAGGDNIRISSINFTLEDPKPKMTELRAMAVADAKAKAEHLAELAGVSLGRPIYISEGANSPAVSGFAERGIYAMAAPASYAAPSISGGEVKLSLNVQVGFSIY